MDRASMLKPPDDTVKRRLTERSHIIIAVAFLIERGISRDDIAEELARCYYVDMDELNDVLAGIPVSSPEPFAAVA
ncbi:MAG: hypothetical protein H6893_14785 [Brucellaceae bacterium]|nr:hypothetical protein [Brucellaceae bacterium]